MGKTGLPENIKLNDTTKISRRVLIIEDNADSAESLQFLLEMNGHIVQTSEDGRSGIETAAEFLPEVVICDIGLPGELAGFQVAAKIRENDHFKDIFMIALSGFGLEKDKERSLSSGFNCHLVKPPDFDYLLEMLQTLTP